MAKTKFTVRMDTKVFESAKQYAGRHGTTVTNLVEEFFRSLEKVEKIPQETPILNELQGSLKAATSMDDYYDYLEEKYLNDRRNDK